MWRLAAVLMVSLGIALPARAQAPRVAPEPSIDLPTPIVAAPQQPAPIDFEGDIEELLLGRLKLAKELEPFKNIADQIRRDPAKFDLDPALVRFVNINDPQMQRILLDLKKKIDEGQFSATELKNLQNLVEQMKTQSKSDSDRPPTASGTAAPSPDALGRVTEQVLQQAQESPFGDWVKNSPAWQRALLELPFASNWALSSSGWGVEDLTEMLTPNDAVIDVAAAALNRISGVQTPAAWHFPLFQVHGGQHRVTGAGAPSLPLLALDGMPGWLPLLILFGGAALWLAARRLGPKAVPGTVVDAPGPSIDLDGVATRADLVRAFDHLALRKLGTRARSWNHRTIAARWAPEGGAVNEAVRVLADLYERARYTAGPAVLAPQERAQAQRALQALFEVPA